MTDLIIDGTPMRFVIHDHGMGSLPLQDAIIRLGGEIVMSNPDILLIDHDGPEYYRDIIERTKAKKTVLYPHGADAFPAWDGVWGPHPETDAVLCWADGYKKVLETYKYPNPVYPIGWYLTELKSFQPTEIIEGTKILYAPVHRLNNGYIRHELLNRNQFVYSWLLAGISKLNIDLTVRHVGNIESSGLWPAYKVTYSRARHDTMISDIEAADIVIACGTFARLAIALGKPTIMYDGDLIYEDGHRRPAMTWNEYKDFIHYPYQLYKDNNTVIGIDPECLRSDEGILEWRELFIGHEFADALFGNTLRMIYNESTV